MCYNTLCQKHTTDKQVGLSYAELSRRTLYDSSQLQTCTDCAASHFVQVFLFVKTERRNNET